MDWNYGAVSILESHQLRTLHAGKVNCEEMYFQAEFCQQVQQVLSLDWKYSNFMRLFKQTSPQH